MNRYDVVIVAYLSKYFKLRLEEAVTLHLFQIEDALKYKQLHVTNRRRF